MTEQEFLTQAWRMYDQVTTADGILGKVLGVSFTTRSVRAYICGAPEWIKCDLIETHITGKGKTCDDAVIIEELHNKVLKQADEIKRLLEGKSSKNPTGEYLKRVMIAIEALKTGVIEKQKRIKNVERGLEMLDKIVKELNKEE